MRLAVLRPAGERLPRIRTGVAEEAVVPPGYAAVFVRSGTAALALALKLLSARAAPHRRRVLLPAYGCPDLVAAVEFNGLVPELVDTAADSPFMSIEHLQERLGEDVLAVVGAHFLGLAENIPRLVAACTPFGVTVIEDSAQKVPGAGSIPPCGDFVVLSFGRGKPAGALGGGALLLKDQDYMRAARDLLAEPVGRGTGVFLRRIAYDIGIQPRPYAFISRVPGLHLGETRYRCLEGITGLDEARRAYALGGWAAAPRGASASQLAYQKDLAGVGDFQPLVGLEEQYAGEPLGRYPVLCRDSSRRERLHEALSLKGLGSSVMYGACLADLPGLPEMVVSRHQNARAFAVRLLTLPTHNDVRPSHIDRIFRAITSLAT